MKAVAYCRVSTNKEDQINSYEAQRQFFLDYAKRNNYNLVKIYGDEGKSGTKMRTRPQLLKLLADAQKGTFELVLIKDVSRLARNTVDFLQSIRQLKSLGVKVIFVNYDQTSSDSSEFMLTLLSAIAQEESYNTSKRVKFGKKLNAEKGKVPNFVFGYDKIKGDYFNLDINEKEAAIVKRIFDMYVGQNIGATKIAIMLNSEGLKTKRGKEWSQNAISRIISNQIYIGKVVNGKQEISDFLTSERKENDVENWIVVDNPSLRIIDDATFEKAQRLLHNRKDTYKITGERHTSKHLFTKLIKCKHCDWSFRRIERKYANTYIAWVCSHRNSKGAHVCPNMTKVDENQLSDAIKDYLKSFLADKNNAIPLMQNEFKKIYKSKDENQRTEKELRADLAKLEKDKKKYVEMFKNDIINISELREETDVINKNIERTKRDIDLVLANISKSDLLGNNLKETFKDIETVINNNIWTNATLGRLIEYITVDKDGNVDIYLKLIHDIGIDHAVQLTDDCS